MVTRCATEIKYIFEMNSSFFCSLQMQPKTITTPSSMTPVECVAAGGSSSLNNRCRKFAFVGDDTKRLLSSGRQKQCTHQLEHRVHVAFVEGAQSLMFVAWPIVRSIQKTRNSSHHFDCVERAHNERNHLC